MRDKADLMLAAALSAFGLCGVSAVALTYIDGPLQPPPTIEVVPDDPSAVATGAAWLAEMRQYCNPVDVETRMSWSPPPATSDGAMHGAACLALAGRIDRAREVLLTLSGDDRWRGAGVVFEVGHPAADAGDELAAGPLMELVVEFWPNHYMALYHAGAAAFERGEPEAAERYLVAFLANYDVEDGWTANGRRMLEEIRAG